jgi:DNA helicase HerA-like ATPase
VDVSGTAGFGRRRASWRFEPRAGEIPGRDEISRRRTEVEAAVHAGHGLGGTFSLLLDSGPDPAIVLTAETPVGIRWVERTLANCYGEGQWSRASDPSAPHVRERYIGRRRLLPGEGASPVLEWGLVTGTATLAFSSLPRGIQVACRFAPVSSRASFLDRLSPSVTRVDRAPPRFGTRALPAQPPAHSRPVGGGGPLWYGTVELRIAPRISPREGQIARGVIETAWRRLDDTGLTLHRAAVAQLIPSRMLLASSEVVALLPNRDGGGAAPRAVRPSPLALPVGRTSAGTVVTVPVEPGQGRHLAILGETGMGKSSLLIALSVRAAALGGIVVLDPLGETAREIRDELRSESDRALFISASSHDALSLNALEGCGLGPEVDAVRSERRIADIVHALRRVRSGRYTDSSFWGPRLEEMLTRAIRAAAAFPDGSLTDAYTLLCTTGLTRRPALPGSEEALRELSQRIRERPEDADGARRLLHEVVRNPTLGRMLCARHPTRTASDLVAPGRILLVSGDAGEVGESTARYLIAVYLALVWSELLARAPASKTFVFLDEAQWFAHESLSEMLRLARRRNVHTILATQSIASLPESVAEAVWTNVADFVAFRGLPDEAREIGRAAPGVRAERILALPRGTAAALVGKGGAVSWVRTIRIPSEARPPGRVEPRPIDSFPASVPVATGDAAVGAEVTPDPPISAAVLLEWLGHRSRTVGAGNLLPISLRELRDRTGGDAETVRRLGATLGRRGAIRRTERTPDGPVWWLDPVSLRGVGPPATTPVLETSEKPQPS